MEICIEYPSTGATYSRQEYGVYGYDEYPEGSVLSGQLRRHFLGSFATLDQAVAQYPEAEVCLGVSQYRPPFLGHLPDGPDL